MAAEAATERESVSLDPELGGAEVILVRLAEALSGGDAAHVVAAWREVDRDGSGALDSLELCTAVRKASGGMKALWGFVSTLQLPSHKVHSISPLCCCCRIRHHRSTP
jgi:hypothetical protein